MGALRDIRSGFSGFGRAFGFVRKNGLAWLFLMPALLWIALGFGLFALIQGPVEEWSKSLAEQLDIPVSMVDAERWTSLKVFLNGARELVLALVLKLAVAYLLYIVNKYLVLVLLSPLLAYASERTEEIRTGRRFPFNSMQLMKDALRGALFALRNGALELLITGIIWIVTFMVPLIAPISLVLLFLVSSYFYGSSMFDYVFERKRMRISESLRAVHDRIGAVMANGVLFNLVMKVPLLGVTFGPVLAAVGASLAELDLEQRKLDGATSSNTRRT